jgi:hypothetical protein
VNWTALLAMPASRVIIDDLLNGQCNNKVQTEVRKLVATLPDVTTINLLHGKHLYCSSIFGGVNFTSDAHSPTKSLFL